jgi:hypothetical protein
MRPETIAKLQSNSPEFRELLAFLASEAQRLESWEGLDKLSFHERAYEVTSRMRSVETIKGILGPLLGVTHSLEKPDPTEYVM